MNAYDSLRAKLLAREKVAGTAVLCVRDPVLAGMMKRDGLDFLVYDMEHAPFTAESLVPHLAACRNAGIPSIVRVPDAQYALVAKTVDMGADGVMLPRTESAGQLQTAVDALWFHPIGRKGVGGGGQFRPGETFEEYQRGRFLLPQIESPEGIRALPGLLDRFGPRVAGVVVGPNDMAVTVGTPGDTQSPPCQAAIAEVFGLCRERGVSAGIFCGGAGEAARYRSLGANILWTGCDIGFLLDGFHRTFDALAALP